MTSKTSSTILEGWRERPPSTYSFKVENFSQFESLTLHCNGKYESRRFSSGVYKWKMIIYPKGNEKDNGSGFISMYVEIDSTSLLSAPQPEVYADIRFFVYNKKENKYFTIQDMEPKPFNTLRTISGLSQVLPVDTFNDLENGYIFDGDHCEFGVDINVASPPTKWEILSFDVELPDPKFSWTIKNFFEIKENPYVSNSFSMGGKEWVLKMYPKGQPSQDGKWLSIFLCLSDNETLVEDEKIYAQTILKVEDPCGSNHLTNQIGCRLFDKRGIGYGYTKLVSIDELRKTYLGKDDSLIVEVECKVVSSTKYSSLT